MASKRDILYASLPDIPHQGGSVSDRMYAQEQGNYTGADVSEPLSLNDYLVANAVDKNVIQ